MTNKSEQQPSSFESVKTRLAEIAEAVDDETLSLDDALDLYEEAVALGLKASDLLESGVRVSEPEPEQDAEAKVEDNQEHASSSESAEVDSQA